MKPVSLEELPLHQLTESYWRTFGYLPIGELICDDAVETLEQIPVVLKRHEEAERVAEASGGTAEGEAMIEDPHDLCKCGDYRRDHPDGGPCIFGSSHGIPRDLPYAKCAGFRLAATWESASATRNLRQSRRAAALKGWETRRANAAKRRTPWALATTRDRTA